MATPDEACLALAGRQQGVLSRAQAASCGLSSDQIDRRLSTGRWKRVFPAVFRIPGAPVTPRQTLWAACLWAGDAGVLSHAAAAWVWGFEKFTDAAPELTTTLTGQLKGVKLHHVQTLPDHTRYHGLPVTALLRTLLDLAASQPENVARAAVDEAMRRRWLTTAKLRALLDAHPHYRGARLLRTMLKEFEGGDGPTESELERQVLKVLADEGLPRPKKQHVEVAGGRVRRMDFVFPKTPVVLEADGYAHHATIAAFEKDRQRRNALTAKGYVVVQWTTRALQERPEVLVAELRALLKRHS